MLAMTSGELGDRSHYVTYARALLSMVSMPAVVRKC